MMEKYKDKWYEPYKIVTVLDKLEVIRRIEGKTQFISFKYKRPTDNLLFFGGKKYEEKYKVYIWPQIIPPRGTANCFLPKAIIEVFAGKEGKSIVYIRLVMNKTYMIFWLIWGTGLISQLGNVLVYMGVLLLVVFLLIKYWEFVRSRIGRLLEELLEVKKTEE